MSEWKGKAARIRGQISPTRGVAILRTLNYASLLLAAEIAGVGPADLIRYADENTDPEEERECEEADR